MEIKKRAESLKNKNLNLINKDGNILIDAFLKGNNNYENNKKISLDNSNICLNFTYSVNNASQSKSLSLPILFPIPNKILCSSLFFSSDRCFFGVSGI